MRISWGVTALIFCWSCGGEVRPVEGPEAPEDVPGPTMALTPPSAPEVAGGRVIPTGTIDEAQAWTGPFTASIPSPQPPEEPPQPAADPRQPGPFQVGVRTLSLVDPSRDRELLVDVWYPVAPETSGTIHRYELSGVLGEIISLEGDALEDAPPASDGPWPLVVFSHGFGGIRFQSHFLTEHLATHGFVVAAPDHPGNRLTDFAQLGSEEAQLQSSVDRPLDILFVTEQMRAGVSGLIVDQVAFTGHSFGGWTILEAGRRDPSVRVLVPLAPGFPADHGVTPDFVADLVQPIAFFGGTADGTCPYDTDQVLPYEIARSPKALIGVEGAGHLDFSNLCDIVIARLFVDDGCDPQSIDPARVHDLTRTIATAFLARYLRGDTAYEAYLDPAYVLGLGPIEYRRSP